MNDRADLLAAVDGIQKRMNAALQRAGRVKLPLLVAVSKKQPVLRMRLLQEAMKCRQLDATFGESYVQEFKQKLPDLVPPFLAHMIGPLQRNKVRDAVRLFDVIESVHSISVLEEIAKEAHRFGKRQPILLQVNISQDPGKSGFSAAELLNAAKIALTLEPLELRGVMTITRLYPDPELARPDFRAVTELTAKLQRTLSPSRAFEISMGMSDDFEVAIEEGATMVRIGTALFGDRTP